MNNIYRLQNIFRDVFENPSLQITPDTAPSNYPDWDSVAMVQVVLAAEADFGIRFTTDEVAGIHSVADILKLLEIHGHEDHSHSR